MLFKHSSQSEILNSLQLKRDTDAWPTAWPGESILQHEFLIFTQFHAFQELDQ